MSRTPKTDPLLLFNAVIHRILHSYAWRLFACVGLALFVYRFQTLTNPPYWDSVLGMFHEGLWLYENQFNYIELARGEVGYQAGGPLHEPTRCN